jgi:P-type E1-E2 ATPase
MLEIDVPGLKTLRLAHLVLDVNGTLALDGILLDGVGERLNVVKSSLQVHLLSADTHGGLAAIAEQLEVSSVRLQPGSSEVEQKAAYLRQLGAGSVAAIGNGANDVGMLREAGLAIAVLGPEGLATGVLEHADILVTSPAAALDLLLRPKRLVATLRR